MKSPVRLLVIDDDPAIRRMFEDLVAKKLGADVTTVEDGASGLETLRREPFDVAIVDYKLPGMSGLEVVEKGKAASAETQFVMMTAFGSIESAVQAIKLGATDYVLKPFKLSQIEAILERARRLKSLEEENRALRAEVRGKYRAEAIVGLTPAMQDLHATIDRVRNEDANILIVGESGTGKELIARAIHYDGARRDRLFVPVDCASIHKNLLESELFGHERGAFTGALSRKIGLFEKAHRGTIFLDEIGEIPLELQPVLLRTLEERKLRPVGSTQLIDLDVRIVAATNRDLAAEVEAGRFRRDLYYRLNVVTIAVPPLRGRKDDVPLLVEHFVTTSNVKHKRQIRGITRDALFTLQRYDWPGNVRELEHVVERACMLGQTEQIEVADLPAAVLEAAERKARSGPAGEAPERSLDELEAEAIVKLLTEHRGDTKAVADILKIDRSTLYRKVRRMGVDLRRLRSGGGVQFENPKSQIPNKSQLPTPDRP